MCFYNRFIVSFIVLFLSLASLEVKAQGVSIDVQDEALTLVLDKLVEGHQLQFSYDYALLKDCKVTLKTKEISVEKALQYLLKNCDLYYKKVGDTYVIFYKKRSQVQPKPIYHTYRGLIQDRESAEPLPFTQLLIDEQHLQTDEQGVFVYRSQKKKLSLQVRHLGYYALDTVVNTSKKIKIDLQSYITDLKEVVVIAEEEPLIMSSGEEVALIKVNHKTAALIPGNNNNSLFNLLRLQSGILASGEQAGSYRIWGSYRGQSQLIYNDITVFSSSSSNDEISTINPQLIKDVHVHKAAYPVDLGNRVGGIVDIHSKKGNLSEFQQMYSFSNQLLATHLNIPLKKESTVLQLALRTSYFDFLNPENYDLGEKYKFYFGDLNLQFYHQFSESARLDCSAFANIDNNQRFSLAFDQELKQNLFRSEDVRANQQGLSLRYWQDWNSAHQSKVAIALSRYRNLIGNRLELFDDRDTTSLFDTAEEGLTTNLVSEWIARIDHRYRPGNHHQFAFGLATIINSVAFSQGNDFKLLSRTKERQSYLSAYVKDNIILNNYLNIALGLRIDWPFRGQIAIQPRLRLTAHLDSKWKLHLAAGIHQQFVEENAMVDRNGNYFYRWSLSGINDQPLLTSYHGVLGTSYNSRNFFFNLEGYVKYTTNIHRFYKPVSSKTMAESLGESIANGMNLSMGTKLKQHQFSLSYSLSRTLESFDYYPMEHFIPAAHDQRHELKALAIFKIQKVFLSSAYVWGSGFNSFRNVVIEDARSFYSRWDLALSYQYRKGRLLLDCGASVLNVLNTKNLRFNDFTSFPNGKQIFFEGIGISPSIFINVHL